MDIICPYAEKCLDYAAGRCGNCAHNEKKSYYAPAHPYYPSYLPYYPSSAPYRPSTSPYYPFFTLYYPTRIWLDGTTN